MATVAKIGPADHGRPMTLDEFKSGDFREGYQYELIDVSPILVAEVLSPDDLDKDLVRNVKLYLQVPSIKEYWLLDNRDQPSQPQLKVHRRHGQRWRVWHVGFGETYSTRLLPGLELVVDPRK